MAIADIMIQMVTSSTVQSLIKTAIIAIADQISSNRPLTPTGTQQARLTSAERRISMGVTKHEGETRVALLVEENEIGERPADVEADAPALVHEQAPDPVQGV